LTAHRFQIFIRNPPVTGERIQGKSNLTVGVPNMKKLINALVVVAALAMSVSVFAQPSAPKASGGALHSQKSAAATKLSGIVKGSPVGKTFTLTSKGKPPVKVDCSKAKIRMNGKFISINDVKGGSIVNVEGKMMGDHFMADKVDVKSIPGKKKN